MNYPENYQTISKYEVILKNTNILKKCIKTVLNVLICEAKDVKVLGYSFHDVGTHE